MGVLRPGPAIDALLLGASTSRQVTDVVILLGVVLVLLLIGTGGIVWARRRLMRSDLESSGAGLTLHDLRQLHAQGKMSDEEYEAARTAILGAHAARKPAGASKVDAQVRPSPGGTSPDSGGGAPKPPHNAGGS